MDRDDDKFENIDVKIRSKETLGSEIGSGKEGTVYEIQDTRKEVAKIIQSERRSDKHDKLKEMIRHPPDTKNLSEAFNQNHPPLAWPIDTIHSVDNDDFLGYSMPRLEMCEYQNIFKYARNFDTDANFRYRVAMDFAVKIALVHANGHAIGDMNHSNILVRDGVVTLIDCDSFHVSCEYQDFGSNMIYSRYAPPDGRSETDHVEEVQLSDQFGLAIHIFQLLMEGLHPFVAVGSHATTGSTKNAIHGNRFPHAHPDAGQLKPPDRAPDYSQLPAEIKSRFSAAFISGKMNPKDRPTAREWVNALAQATDMTWAAERCKHSLNIPQSGNSGTSGASTGNNGIHRKKWEKQREQRRRRSSSGSEQAPSTASPTSGGSSPERTADGQSYNRDRPNYQQFRESSSDGGSTGTSSTTTSSTSSSSGATSNSTTPSTSSFSVETSNSARGSIITIMIVIFSISFTTVVFIDPELVFPLVIAGAVVFSLVGAYYGARSALGRSDQRRARP